MTAEAKTASGPAREIGFDVARGLLILYVVTIIHGVYWLVTLRPALVSIVLFEMPPIFMLSGAAYSLSASRAPPAQRPLLAYGGYLLRRVVRFLVPYWAYALACWALVVFYFHDAYALNALNAWLNPVQFGEPHDVLMLNWHLWFIAPFLMISALLPIATRIRIPWRAPLWCWAALGALVIWAAGFVQDDLFRQVVFYALWALFGYALAASPKRYGVHDYMIVLVFSLTVLGVCGGMHLELDMQINKFPPNLQFFLFSCAWVSVFMLMTSVFDRAFVERLGRAIWLKPFMRAGYSIYLWQGLGYSAAQYAGARLGWPLVLIWVAAIALTVALGLIASPLERVRWKGRATPGAP